MTLLAPLALLWLLGVPILVWLWRLAATRRVIRVPSLIPFEHLMRRQAKSRRHVVVNLLFWIQLSALLGLTLALARPVLSGRRTKLVLVVLDTSASMEARGRGPSALERAKQALAAHLARKAPADHVFVMLTAPVTALLPKPTSDGAELSRLLGAVRARHLGGNLATAARIGRALVATEPDDTVILTDEPAPAGPREPRVQWMTVGEPLPNVAIVGLDVRGPLCAPANAHVLVTVQNFSREASDVTVTALQDGKRLGETSQQLGPGDRRALSLALPETATGPIEIVLTAPHDALAVDDRAWIALHQHDTVPIVVRSSSPSFVRTMSEWLSACPTIGWTLDTPPGQGPYLLVTDREAPAASAATGTLLFLPPPSPTPVRSYWVASADHPISSYLAPVELVSASVHLVAGHVATGTPVISGLVQGRRIPIVAVDERDGHPVVSMFLDPVGGEEATPVLLAFFNSLRWLMGRVDVAMTGDVLSLGGFEPGIVLVRRPDGSTERAEVSAGPFHYEATSLSGTYRFTQGAIQDAVSVNFLDPLESNTLDHPSTWHAAPLAPSGTAAAPPRTDHPLWSLLVVSMLGALLVEWWFYSAKGRVTVRPDQPASASR